MDNNLSSSAVDKSPVIFLMGPTASGKTALAMQIQDRFPVELVSVDSALIYRGMDIGTAKPTVKEQERYPHHLIDIREPTENYSAADFQRDAYQVISEIHARQKIPLLVGGTMLYFKALLEGLSPLPQADQATRNNIEEEAKEKGWEGLHQQLQDFDPQSAARLHPNDSQRISRAIEVYRLTGRTLTELQSETGESFDYPLLQIAVMPEDRAWLHERIALRFNQMLEQGFIQEMEGLIARGDLYSNLPSMRCVGYRQAWEYLHNQYDHDEFIFRGVSATRQLAKRQITWLRSWQNVEVFTPEQGVAEMELINKKLSLFLSNKSII